MGNVIFLIPPSEGKNPGGDQSGEFLSFVFMKPKRLANSATEKDLKCTGTRYNEGITLNNNIFKSGTEILKAIERYSGVMYNSINYENMTHNGKCFFEENFLILSGMYGMLRPLDAIANYKLPIETKGLYDFWSDKILEIINNLEPQYVVNLLPISYGKLIYGKNKSLQVDFEKKRKFTIINVNFLNSDGSKISHGVKKIKGQWIYNISQKKISDYRDFGGIITENDDNTIDVDITVN